MTTIIEKWKGLKKWQKWAVGIGVFFVIGLFIPEKQDLNEGLTEMETINKEDKHKADSLAQRKDDLIGCYINARNILKENMKNPKSYDELNSEYYYLTDTTDKGGVIQVMIDYTGTNSFGGTIRSKQIFHYDEKMYLVNTFESR